MASPVIRTGTPAELAAQPRFSTVTVTAPGLQASGTSGSTDTIARSGISTTLSAQRSLFVPSHSQIWSA